MVIKNIKIMCQCHTSKNATFLAHILSTANAENLSSSLIVVVFAIDRKLFWQWNQHSPYILWRSFLRKAKRCSCNQDSESHIEGKPPHLLPYKL